MTFPVFCISLPKRGDRRDALKKEWRHKGFAMALPSPLEFVEGVQIADNLKGPPRIAAADMACAIAHRNAVERAAAMDAEAVLVLEDDALPAASSAALGQFLFNTLRGVTVGWDTVNLGGCSAQWRPATPMLRWERISDEVFRVQGMVTTHAIVYHRRVFADILCAVPSEEEVRSTGFGVRTSRPYDQWLASHGTMLTGAVPYFVQSGSTSDILGVPHGVDIAELIHSTYARLRSSAPV